MKKRYLFMLIISAIILAIAIAISGDKGDIFYGRYQIVSEKKARTIISELTLADDNFESITLNNTPIPYDDESKTFYIVQNMNTDDWNGSIEYNNGHVYWAEDDYWNDKSKAISEGHIFRLWVIDDVEGAYGQYNCIFTGMPVLCITTEEMNVGAFADDENANWKGGFSLSSASRKSKTKYGYEYQETTASYKHKGATSLGYPKQSLRIELDEKLKLLDLRKDDDWQLNSLYDDWGLVHNELSYKLWSQIAASNDIENDEAIDEDYVEVVIDNQYMGVYLLQERYDAKKAKITENDRIYKSWAPMYPDGVDTLWYFATQKYPEEVTEETLMPLWDWCRSSWVDLQLSYDDAKNIIYYDNTIDYTIFLDVTAAQDNHRKNIYYVARKQSDGGYKLMIIPWDLNITWGMVYSGDGANHGVGFGETVSQGKGLEFCGIWGLMDMNCDETADAIYQRWEELRESIITKKNIYNILDNTYSYLKSSGAYDRNYEKWPHGYETWDEQCLYDFIEERIDFMDEFYLYYKNNPHTYTTFQEE